MIFFGEVRVFMTAVSVAFAGAAVASATDEALAPGGETADDGGFAFIVLGDTPYSSDDEVMLAEALPAIKAGDYPFIVHIGDYKGGGAQCVKKFDDRMAALIADLAPTPVFYTPGDNEWTDCDRHTDPTTGEKYSDLARLAIVRDRFFAAPPETPENLQYERQPALLENATWVFEDVRFLTVHITGTNNGRDWVTVDALEDADAEADRRDAANLAWLGAAFDRAAAEDARAVVIATQADVTDVKGKPKDKMCDGAAKSNRHPCDAFADFRAALRDKATAFGKPVLLIHGDTAPFTLGQSIAGEEAPNLWRLNAAGDAGVNRIGVSYGVRDVTRVEIDPAASAPFAAKGLLTGATPKAR